MTRARSIRLFFRLAFLYCAILFSLSLAHVLFNSTFFGLPIRTARLVDGSVMPLALASVATLMLGLPIDLKEVVPFRMLCGALSVAAIYAWGQWVGKNGFRAFLGIARIAISQGGATDILGGAVLTFFPLGGLLGLTSFLALASVDRWDGEITSPDSADDETDESNARDGSEMRP